MSRTRIQRLLIANREHPVSEQVTGVDLVTLQFRIANGLLVDSIGDIGARGHAIEFRINAESAAHSFAPSAGTHERWRMPQGPGIRIDTHCFDGYTIPPYYDSLLAELVVTGRDRLEAIARARRAFQEVIVEGVPTTLPFHRWLLQQGAFLESTTTTAWAEPTWEATRNADAEAA